MAWPTALTQNSDILRYVFEQGITRMLEGSNTYSDLHEGIAEELGIWLEKEGGISDRNEVSNTSDYKLPAAYLFVSKILQNRDERLSNRYYGFYLSKMQGINVKLIGADDEERGGPVAKIGTIRNRATDFRGTGAARHYNRRRPGARFR